MKESESTVQRDTTEVKATEGNLECKFTVNGRKPHEMKVKYKRDTKSVYSGCPLSINCYSMNQCSSVSNDPEIRRFPISFENYHPYSLKSQ